MTELKTGMTYTSSLRVENQHLACNVGSGDLQVLSTPIMMALMENASMLVVADSLEENQSTVGSEISSTHLRPTPLGGIISATAELIAIESRKLSFKVVAQDEKGIIGEGTHTRYIIDKTKFMAKLQG